MGFRDGSGSHHARCCGGCDHPHDIDDQLEEALALGMLIKHIGAQQISVTFDPRIETVLQLSENQTVLEELSRKPTGHVACTLEWKGNKVTSKFAYQDPLAALKDAVDVWNA